MEKTSAAFNFKAEVKGTFHTVLADPPWRYCGRNGIGSPENKKNFHYSTLSLPEIKEIPVQDFIIEPAHLYLWIPNAMIQEGLDVMKAWGFSYKVNLVWHKICKDGRTDSSGLGYYFRNATELVLFGTTGKGAQTLKPGRTQVNHFSHRKQGHSVKPDELYRIIEGCSRGKYLEMFARRRREQWVSWGNQLPDKAKEG